MQHDPHARLWDVRQAAETIMVFVQGREFADYAANLMLGSAVERQFEISGEALNRLSGEAAEIAARLPDLRRAIAVCNALIHGYREVDNATVWQTIQDDRPALWAQVGAPLAAIGDDP